MAFRVVSPEPQKIITWFAKDAAECYAGVLVKHNSGADPVAAAHTGATILGVVLDDQLSANGLVRIASVHSAVMAVDFAAAATKQSCAVTDLGSQFDLVAVGDEQFIDLDDTTGGFLILVGYDNYRKIAYVTVEDADCLLAI